MRLALAYFVSVSTLVGQASIPLPYQNSDLGPEQRAADLVSRMTLTEKVSQMQNDAAAIPRLGVLEYNWWNEGLHGVARAGLSTVFPQAIGLAATWATGLMQRVATAISTEARAKFHDAQRRGDRSLYHGLTFWSPNINIFRDPRWGRGQETYGEDPYLTARMAVSFVRGMQGDDPRYLKTIATPKHFAVHSGPEPMRHTFDARVGEAVLNGTYLAAFRAAIVEGGAFSLMCAYNSVDGVPACANADLLTARLRGQWGFRGYVVSDCGAVGDIATGHKYTADVMTAAAAAVLAGTDLSCGPEYGTLTGAVQAGLLPESVIDRAVTRLFAARFRLGLFDSPERVAYASTPLSEVDSSEHRALALEAAGSSIVLLKNTGVLPLSSSIRKIAVVGPAADAPDMQMANYSGIASHIVTPIEGISQRFGSSAAVQYALGSTYTEGSLALVPPEALPGLQVEYFANADLSGVPVVTRAEPRIYFNYDAGDPAVQAVVPRAAFSVRWTASLKAPYDGDYAIGVLRAQCDNCTGVDSARVYLDGAAIITDATPRAFPHDTQRASVHLAAGSTHQIRVEYRQAGSGTGVELAWAPPADALLAEARGASAGADVTLLFVGLNSDLEGEEMPLNIPGFAFGDRTSLDLPAPQLKLIRAVLDAGKPVVVILMTGSAVNAGPAHEEADAVLEAWYPGEEGGTAVAQVLAGDVNPSGRLPVTFYRSVDQLPAFDDYSMAGRTYRFFTGDVLYGFGSGLSYSTFRYSNLTVGARLPGRRAVKISARVTNESVRDGDEIVQMYTQGPAGPELRGFERVHLRAGESRMVSFVLEESRPGPLTISVGGGQPVAGTLFVQRLLPFS